MKTIFDLFFFVFLLSFQKYISNPRARIMAIINTARLKFYLFILYFIFASCVCCKSFSFFNNAISFSRWLASYFFSSSIICALRFIFKKYCPHNTHNPLNIAMLFSAFPNCSYTSKRFLDKRCCFLISFISCAKA